VLCSPCNGFNSGRPTHDKPDSSSTAKATQQAWQEVTAAGWQCTPMGQLTRKLAGDWVRGCCGRSRTLVLSTTEPSSLRSGSQTCDSTDGIWEKDHYAALDQLRTALPSSVQSAAQDRQANFMGWSATAGSPRDADGTRTAAIDSEAAIALPA
jgi:hypothetical protein